MRNSTVSRTRVPFYLVPILVGMGGVLFSRQLPDPALRVTVLLISVALPLFVGGNILTRMHARGWEKTFVITTMVLLLAGAVVTVSGFSDALARQAEIPVAVAEASRWLGMLSLLVGIATILFWVVRTDEAVEEVAERFRHLAEHIGEGFVLTSSDGVITLVNHSFLEMTGLREDEILGEHARVLATRLGLDLVLAHLNHRHRGLASEYQIDWKRRGEPRQFLISGTPIYNRRGQLAGTLATVRDITEQQRMAKNLERYTQGLQKLVEDRTLKLRHSEEVFRELLLHMNEGFITVDAAFRIRFANERIRGFLQVRLDGLLNRDLFDFVDVSARGKLLDLFAAAQSRNPERIQQEFDLIRLDGTRISVMAAVAPISELPSAAAEGPRFSLVITDISELKRMQQQVELRAAELEVANEELRILDRTKDSFLSNVSHELRTPLSTVRGYIEMLESNSLGSNTAPQMSALRVMERNVQRLSVLIDEMIEFSRMEIRGIQLNLTLFRVDALIQECVSSIQPQGLAKDVSINIHVQDDLSFAWGDRKRIGQVLSIFLSNAVKFSYRGGIIQVRAGQRDGRHFALDVADTGVGIDPIFHRRVFDKFFQVDSSPTRRYEGTGIGLSIAKSIAETHGGYIELTSEPNAGSTFALVLPDAVFGVGGLSVSRDMIRNLHVMVADDDLEFRSAITKTLTRAGCAVHEVKNGYECLRASKEIQPDVVFLNGALADLSGSAIWAKLQADLDTSDVPVVILCGRERRSIREIHPGGKRPFLLEKPFTAEALVATLHDACFTEEAPDDIENFQPEARPRALIVDPDGDYLEWLTTGLRHRQIDCFSAADKSQALELARTCAPDVVFLDADASESDGTDAVKSFHEAEITRDVPIYFMTGFEEEHQRFAGAAGLLKKPFSIQEIAQLITTAIAGSAPTNSRGHVKG